MSCIIYRYFFAPLWGTTRHKLAFTRPKQFAIYVVYKILITIYNVNVSIAKTRQNTQTNRDSWHFESPRGDGLLEPEGFREALREEDGERHDRSRHARRRRNGGDDREESHQEPLALLPPSSTAVGY